MNYNIAVLYIAIGNYSVMYEEFIASAKKFLFPNYKKHFYVFTDDEKLLNACEENVTFIREKNYGWPGNTLYRFRMFLTVQDELKTYDYAYFFNANTLFVKIIEDEILPKNGSRIVAAQHFKMRNIDPIKYEYDRNQKSTACVKWGGEGKDYVQACLIGATGAEMVHMCKVLSENIAIDEKNGVIARWHDESHFNKYIIDKQYTLLPVSYVYPEVLELPIDVNILMRNKERYGNLSTLRYGKKSFFRWLRDKMVFQCRKIQCAYHMIIKNLITNKKR